MKTIAERIADKSDKAFLRLSTEVQAAFKVLTDEIERNRNASQMFALKLKLFSLCQQITKKGLNPLQ